MAIEFYCPGCGKLMRTPDPTAGRKGRCPHCATKVQIPMTSITSQADTPSAPNQAASTPTQPAATRPVGQPANNDPIQFVCASCQKTLRVPTANAGKKGKCPHCSAVMTIPSRSTAANQPTGEKWKGAPRPAASAAPIQFTCPGCQKSVRVNASAAGKQGQCPHCQTVVKIPQKTSVTPAPTATPGLTPLDNSGGLTPLDVTTGLTPLDSTGGLTPLGVAPDPFAGAADPFASAADPFGGLTELSAPGGFASQDPFGGAAAFPAASTNPYSSPMATSSAATSPGVSRRKGKRSGLPWDNKHKDNAPFTGTIKLVLFSPATAFSLMRRSGGDSNPLLFCIFGNLIGGVFAIIYQVVWDLIITMPARLEQQGGQGQAGAYVVGMVIVLVVGLFLLVLFTVIGVYINAGIFHVCLMVMGGANQSFETSVRVVQYTMGSTALCGVIPVVGGFIQFIANVVILSIGLANAHETSGVKATIAVLIPFIVCIVSLVGIVMLIVAMFAAAATQG